MPEVLRVRCIGGVPGMGHASVRAAGKATGKVLERAAVRGHVMQAQQGDDDRRDLSSRNS
jgi:hypothetical protein